MRDFWAQAGRVVARTGRGGSLGLLAVTLLACSKSTDNESHRAQFYASVSADNTVLAIDDATHKITRRYAVGKGPAILISTPDHKKLYTANWADNSVSAIELATGKVNNIPVGERPYVIAMDPSGERVYAGLNKNEIAVIETSTDTVSRAIATDDMPASVIVSPDGETLYVAMLNVLSLGSGSLQAISALTGEVIHDSIAVGRVPAWITISPDGSKVYTLNFLSDDVSVVDTDSWKVIATVSTGMGSQAIIGNVTPDGSRLYVTNHGNSTLAAIDTATNQIVQTIPLTGRPVGVNFNADGSHVYITDFGPESQKEAPQLNYLLTGNFNPTGPGQVSVYDTASGELVGDVLTVGAGPTSIVVEPE